MQERFKKALKKTLAFEGGYVNDPIDPGGATKYGISLRFLKNIKFDVNQDGKIDIDDIKDLCHEITEELYYEHFWCRYRCHAIENDKIAEKYFDMCVNMGGRQASLLLQRAINKFEPPSIVVDGIAGQQTLKRLNGLIHSGYDGEFLIEYKTKLKSFYSRLIKMNPKLVRFRNGWYRRAMA